MTLKIINPCQVCGNKSGKCRESDDGNLLLCMESAQAPSGFKFIGPTKDRLWNQFVEGEEMREDSSIQALTIVERDEQYQRLLNLLTLSESDRADLERRGFTPEQIERFEARSVRQWQPVPEGLVSEPLPGVLPGGKLNTQEGYIAPIRDVDGLIVAFQIRQTTSGDGGRYRWLTSKTKKNPDGASPHVDGELPISVHQPQEKTSANIGLCEGTGVKPFLAAERSGQVMIGAAGGNFPASKDTLKKTLLKLAGKPKSPIQVCLTFYPDAGSTDNPQVLKTYRATFELIERLGYSLNVAWWGQDAKEKPDIDELTDFDQIEYLTLKEFWAKCPVEYVPIQPEVESGAEEEKPSKLAASIAKFSKVFGDRLRFNQVTACYELDGKSTTLEELEISLALDFNLDAPRNFGLVVKAIAKPYHPVREYLEGCYAKHGENTLSVLDGIAERHFGTSNPLHQLFLQKWLIGVVRRVFEPGTKLDTVLTLHGKQGAQKSSWFRELANGCFDDSIGNVSDKDERIKLHRSWLNEWGEVEAVFKRKDIALIKSFTTTQVDRLRPPYGREVVDMPRWSAIVASTNQDEFLADATGNRRFWVIPVKQRVDLELIRQEREQIWAAAVALHFQGEPHWLDEAGDQAAAEAVKFYETSDPWEGAILDYLDNSERTETAVEDLLFTVLQIELKDLDRTKQMRVSDILKRAGWVRTERREARNGKRVRLWMRGEQSPVVEPQEQPAPLPTPQPVEQSQPLPVQAAQPDKPITTSALSAAKLTPGSTVTYKGTKHPELNSGQVLTIHSKDSGSGYVCVMVPKTGRLSTWIAPSEFEPCNPDEWEDS